MAKPNNEEEAEPSAFVSTAELNQTYDGETDPVFLIKLGNLERIYKQKGMPWPPPAPLLSAINPSEAQIGGPDFTLVASGTGFGPHTKIVFNGGVELTTVVSSTECQTVVKPSLASIAVSVPVLIRNLFGESRAKTFSFIEAGNKQSPSFVETDANGGKKEKDDEKDDQKVGKQKAGEDEQHAAKTKGEGKASKSWE